LGISEEGEKGSVLLVEGADLMNGTPILDIKPYLPYADIRMEATGGFTDGLSEGLLSVCFTPEAEAILGEERTRQARLVLAQDPRPRYQDDEERIYGMAFAGFNLRFRVQEGVLTVLEAKKL
ncbi:MAG: SAM-dependent methyltransferase, partial [Blautia sp.]|nr:SAM-dependent methyltransferase [Blautia sp.]